MIDQWFYLTVCVVYLQGAEVSGDRDGDVHRHVLSLPADQDHEERPDTDTRVSAAADLQLEYCLVLVTTTT